MMTRGFKEHDGLHDEGEAVAVMAKEDDSEGKRRRGREAGRKRGRMATLWWWGGGCLGSESEV